VCALSAACYDPLILPEMTNVELLAWAPEVGRGTGLQIGRLGEQPARSDRGRRPAIRGCHGQEECQAPTAQHNRYRRAPGPVRPLPGARILEAGQLAARPGELPLQFLCALAPRANLGEFHLELIDSFA